MKSLDDYRIGWIPYTVLLLATWWVWGNPIGVAAVWLFFGVWWWNAERTQQAAEREQAIERAEEEFATFDPKTIALDRQLAAFGENYYDGVIEDRQRLLNARKHRVILMLRERGLVE